jgi:hypothetical protein
MSGNETHRWFTPVLLGRWCASAEEALFDALHRGQAVRNPDPGGAIVLRPFAAMEVREPRPRAPAGDRRANAAAR